MRYLTAEELKKSHSQEAREVLQDHVGKNIQGMFALNLFRQAAERAFGNKKDIKVLDLGPAGGAFGKQLAQAGYQNIYGADLDDYLSLDNRPSFKELKTADLSTERLPWQDGYFQAITAWCVFPHLENPFHCFREVRRVLSKDGLFIFSAPNLESRASADYFARHKDFGSYQQNNNHLVAFTRGIIDKAVLKYFSLVEIRYHVRDKIFDRGIKGSARKLTYAIVSRMGKWWKAALEKRWAYNTIYILKPRPDLPAPIPKSS